MSTKNMFDITGVDLIEVAKAAYSLSKPQGMGYLHYEEGDLSDEEAAQLITNDARVPLSMDYVKGRACKLTVFRDGESLYISDTWYDHTESDLLKLIDMIT